MVEIESLRVGEAAGEEVGLIVGEMVKISLVGLLVGASSVNNSLVGFMLGLCVDRLEVGFAVAELVDGSGASSD